MGVPVISSIGKKVFGSRNDRLVKKYMRLVDQVSLLEPETRPLTDQQLHAKTDEFRQRIKEGATATSLLPEVFAVAREAMDRSVGIRNIFNPDLGFDPSQLDDAARALFDTTKAEIDATEPRAPDKELLGCVDPTPSWQFVEIPPDL